MIWSKRTGFRPVSVMQDYIVPKDHVSMIDKIYITLDRIIRHNSVFTVLILHQKYTDVSSKMKLELVEISL